MLNHIVIQGRFTRDPELRYTQKNDPVVSFTIACDPDYGDKTEFINVSAWKQTAEFVSKYFKKGMLCLVSGRLTIREWNEKDGNKRKNAEIIADRVYFGESKKKEGNDWTAMATNAPGLYGGELPF